MTNSYATDNGTLAHEIGHYFNLFHTHETSLGVERVIRTTTSSCTANCDTSGDLLCDTPSDPGLDTTFDWPATAELVDADCNYTGAVTDNCSQQYTPDTHNIMSYAYSCRSNFSSGQIARMLTSLSMDRPEITSGCNAGPCPIDETITSTITNGSNETYQASNSITGSNIVENGATGLYDATFEVTLTPDFDAVYGSDFVAKLGGCVPNDNPNGTSIDMRAQTYDRAAPQNNTQDLGVDLNLKLIPNPIKQNGIVQYTLSEESMVSIALYDLREVKTKNILVNITQKSGTHRIPINKSNLITGIYIVELIVNEKRSFKKLIVE